jgi:hypothetical protein
VSDRIDNLRSFVEATCECPATHEGSVPVKEMFGQQTVWEGIVESFTLTGHPKAERCYAWSYIEEGKPIYVTVIELPPVNSAQTAVRLAIASGEQK